MVTTQWTAGPDLLPHFNGFPAAKINGNAVARLQLGRRDQGDGGRRRRKCCRRATRSRGPGLAFEEKKSGGTSGLAFVFGFIIVFLVLAAQYESWTLPGAVMSAVPFGILGALLTNHLRGLDNDVYFQIGLLVLIGLGAKNAVLRVSAAIDFRNQGKSIMEATILAGEQRLRPIIMTSLAFAIGCLPLALAVGAGANARHSIGTGIIGGMLGETTLAMLYVPLLFYLFDKMKEGKEEKKKEAPAAERRRLRTDDCATTPLQRSHASTPGVRTRPRSPGARRAWPLAERVALAHRRHACAACCSPAAWSAPTTRARPIDAPKAFIYEVKDAADTANTQWWKQFNDPVLDQLIAEALANNLNVKVAAANVEQAAGVLTQTRSGLFPQVGYDGTAGRARVDRSPARTRSSPARHSQSAVAPTRRCSTRAGRSTCGAASAA